MSSVRKGRSSSTGKCEWVFTSLRQAVQEFADTKPSFGARLGMISGEAATDVVVAHRIVSKLEVPNSTGAAKRRSSSIESMLKRDEQLKEPEWNEHIRLAGVRVQHWFRHFRPSYRFAAPSGASAKPYTYDDIALKLSKLENWEVSPRLFTYAFNIVWSNHALKKLVRTKFREKFPYLTMNEAFREKHGRNGYAIFREQFKCLVTFRGTSRVETVPKNNSEDRVITCEPLWDMICQLSFMGDMRHTMRTVLGIDIRYRAELHGTLLPHKKATIDLKTASDLHHKELIRMIWGPMWRYLGVLRPEIVEVGGEYYPLNMFAPMGTGVTFDVMTVTLLALLRTDRSVSVFGDDIICSEEFAPKAVEILESVNLVVNKEKSFLAGKFKESCGSMYHQDVGYIVSYDIRWPESLCDVITTCNKLKLILQAKQISFHLEGILENHLLLLLETLPRVVFADVELSLSSEVVTGWSVKRPANSEKEQYLESSLQRSGTFARAYQTYSPKAKVKPDAGTAFAMLLYRGLVEPTEKRTEIAARWLDVWSGQRIAKLEPVSLETPEHA